MAIEKEEVDVAVIGAGLSGIDGELNEQHSPDV